MGDRNEISAGTVLGADPLDKAFRGERGCLRIGSGNKIREHCTISRRIEPGAEAVIGVESPQQLSTALTDWLDGR
jgi:UDP-N-acetylglucosamine acyltransferase